jgi:hypothetical protein
MPWFRHHYFCDGCNGDWLAEAEVVVVADCRFCGARDVFPYKSDDRSLVIEPERGRFVVLEASRSARQDPDYRRRQAFRTRAQAEALIAGRRRRAG